MLGLVWLGQVSTSIHLSALGVVNVSVTTIGIGLLECCMDPEAHLCCSQTSLSVVMLDVRLLETCRMVSRGFYWFNLHFEVGVAKLVAMTLGVDFQTSLPVASRGSSALRWRLLAA
jgi:hypothetical protein